MDDVERDSSITVNIGFGNITFHKDERGGYAHAIVDIGIVDTSIVDIGSALDRGASDQIEIAFTIPASPATDTISDIVERSRLRLAALLRTAAAHFDGETVEGLLYPEAPPAE